MPKARSIECECTSRFTCGYCCRNAKPWFYTPGTSIFNQPKETTMAKYSIEIPDDVLGRFVPTGEFRLVKIGEWAKRRSDGSIVQWQYDGYVEEGRFPIYRLETFEVPVEE